MYLDVSQRQGGNGRQAPYTRPVRTVVLTMNVSIVNVREASLQLMLEGPSTRLAAG